MKKTITILKMGSGGKLTRHPGGERVSIRRTSSKKAAPNSTKLDPENPPLTKRRLGKMRRVPHVKVLRRALGLTQEQFSALYQIPLGTLRDWEQGRSQPDLPTRAYLKVIARDPGAVTRALEG